MTNGIRDYKQSDANGVPVSANVASQILNDLRNDQIMNTAKQIMGTVTDTQAQDMVYRAYGDPMPVSATTTSTADVTLPDEDLNFDGSQTKLLKTVVEFLNQVSTPLYFSNNRFLSSAAKDLANKLSDQFCIG